METRAMKNGRGRYARSHRMVVPGGALALAMLLTGGMAAGQAQAAPPAAGDWVLRGGATWVLPNEDTTGAAGPRASDGTLAGSEVDVGNSTQFGFTIGYFLSEMFAVELLAATPFKHRLRIDGGALDGAKLGSIKHLPPSLNLQFHLPTGTPVRPYVGAGINYTLIFDESVADDAKGVGVRDLEVKDSFGFSGQVGVDFELRDGWLISADARYLDIDTTARVKMDDGTTRVDVDIDPWVVTLAIGRRF